MRDHNIFILTFLLMFGFSKCYQIGNLSLERLDDGFTISLPEHDGISRVAFNINRNRAFTTFEQGEFSGEIRHPTNGKYSYNVKKPLNLDDVIYVWVSVQHKNLNYRKKMPPITLNQHSQGDLTSKLNNEFEKDSSENEAVEKTQTCEATITTYVKKTQSNVPRCRGDIIFEENFIDNTLNTDVWFTEVRLANEECEEEFVVYNTSNVAVTDGYLKLKATLWNDNRPGTEIRQGMLDLGEKCTEVSKEYCIRQPARALTLPPVISGRINTKYSFTFKYGRVLIRAKFPDGDWLYPLLLLEPTLISINDPLPCFNARIAFARGNRHLMHMAARNEKNIDIGASRLSGGAILSARMNNREEFLVNKTSENSLFSDNFHVYEMIWSEESLIFKVDDAEYGRIEIDSLDSKHGRRMELFDRQLALTLGLAVGGHADFPEQQDLRKPWINTSPKAALHFWKNRDIWLQTWKNPELQVDFVRVYAV